MRRRVKLARMFADNFKTFDGDDGRLSRLPDLGLNARPGGSGPEAREYEDTSPSHGASQHLGPMHVYEPVIGLEIHAQLADRVEDLLRLQHGVRRRSPTRTSARSVSGLPGALPVLNRRGGRSTRSARRSRSGARSRRSRSSRARITSIRTFPRAIRSRSTSGRWRPDGVVEFGEAATVDASASTRVHLEEDAGKSLHEGFPDSDRKTYVDFNRSGVPLIEIVTEPDLRSAADAAEFFERLRATLVWLGVNDGNMEEGSLRCDANVSVRPASATTLGTKAEVKNLNSFRFSQKALEYEIERQIDVIDDGGRDRSGDAGCGTSTHRQDGVECGARKKRTITATSRNLICRR